MITRNFVTNQTLRDIDDVNKRCKDLHVPAPPFVFVTTEVFNADGTTALKQIEQARSWTRNFYNYLLAMTFPHGTDVDPSSLDYAAGSLNMKEYAGTIRSSGTLSYPGNSTAVYYAGNGTDTGGILVGTGNNAFSFENYGLQTIINNGTSSGQLSRITGVVGTPTYDSGTKKWTKTYYRDFYNGSGGSIDVSETGLYWPIYVGGNYTFNVERNVLASPVTVADGQTLRVTYTTEMTFPA